MRFFGLKVKPGVAYDVQVPKGKRLHLTAACVDSLKACSGVVVVAVIDSKEHNIAVLGQGQPMVNLDLIFSHGQEVAFSLKEGDKVTHLSGYFELDTDMYFTDAGALQEFGDDSDSEGEWVSDEDDEGAIKEAMKELAQQREAESSQPKAKKGKTGKRAREEPPQEQQQQPEEPKKKKKKKKKQA